MKNRDKLSHLSNAYWHLDLIASNNPKVEAVKEQIQALINNSNKEAR